MTAHEPRTLGYYAASHWFQSAVVFLMLGALALFLLKALSDVEEQAERQAVELTLRNMRTGMQFAMAEALMRQREGEIANWAGSDPTRWLEAPPAGYRGECSAVDRASLPEGAWCFERESGQLVYRPRNARQLRGLVDGQQCGQLVWRVVKVGDGPVLGGLVDVRIEVASPCTWIVAGS
jgi:hypothetical protein